MLCELNARRGSGEQLTDNERIIADSYGGGGEVDINAESLEFDIAALLGKIVSRVRYQYKYIYLPITHFGTSEYPMPMALLIDRFLE